MRVRPLEPVAVAPGIDPNLRGLLLHALQTGETGALFDWLTERNGDPDLARAVRENVIRELGEPPVEVNITDITTTYPPGSIGAALLADFEWVAANPPHDYGPNRCEVCGWTLARTAEDGCVPGNCSYRPADGSLEAARIRDRRADLERRRTT